MKFIYTYEGTETIASGIEIKEEAFIPPGFNVLIRKFTIIKNPNSKSIKLIYYGQFNVTQYTNIAVNIPLYSDYLISNNHVILRRNYLERYNK